MKNKKDIQEIIEELKDDLKFYDYEEGDLIIIRQKIKLLEWVLD